MGNHFINSIVCIVCLNLLVSLDLNLVEDLYMFYSSVTVFSLHVFVIADIATMDELKQLTGTHMIKFIHETLGA